MLRNRLPAFSKSRNLNLNRKPQWSRITTNGWRQLDQDTRVAYLANKLREMAASAQREPAKEDPPNEAVPNDGQTAAAPSPYDAPLLDVDAIKARLADSLGDDVAAVVAEQTIAPLHQHILGWTGIVQQALLQQDKTIKELKRQLSEQALPSRLAEALPKVPGATEADVKSAAELMRKGVVATEEAAIRLAVAYRQEKLNKAKRTASPEARKRAKALAASPQATAGATPGTPQIKPPANALELAKLLREAES